MVKDFAGAPRRSLDGPERFTMAKAFAAVLTEALRLPPQTKSVPRPAARPRPSPWP